MKHWLKRLLIVLTIPFLTLALTACPGPDDNGADLNEPAIEDGVAGGGESVEDSADELGEDVEEGAETLGDDVEEGAEEVEEEVEEGAEDVEEEIEGEEDPAN